MQGGEIPIDKKSQAHRDVFIQREHLMTSNRDFEEIKLGHGIGSPEGDSNCEAIQFTE